jgi:acetylglutamate kinase
MRLLIKLGGKVLEEARFRTLLSRQAADLLASAHKLTLVHGGGAQLSELCRRLGIPVVRIQGRRVTDEGTLEAAKMVFSSINRDLTAALLSQGVPAIGMAAGDGFLTRCVKRPPLQLTHFEPDGSLRSETVDFGLVGEIAEVRASVIESLWTAGVVPVVCCLCTDDEGRILNINADTLAARLASALRVDRLVFVSDVDGLYLNPEDASTLIPRLSMQEAREFLHKGVIRDGMVPKVQAALAALEGGIRELQLIGAARLREGIEGDAGTILYWA